jgi:hypothetical protein
LSKEKGQTIVKRKRTKGLTIVEGKGTDNSQKKKDRQ